MCIECITDPRVTVDDVMTAISQLNNSAAGHDGLPASIMKKLSNDYMSFLLLIVQTCQLFKVTSPTH